MQDETNRSGNGIENHRHHWHEYPFGLVGEMGNMLSHTLRSFGIGVLIALGITFFTAFAINDHSVADLIAETGVARREVRAIAQTTDSVARISLALVLILGLLSVGGLCLAQCVRDIAVSRSVCSAVDNGAPRTSVPIPQQVNSIAKDRFDHLWWFLYYGIPLPAFILLSMAAFLSAETPILSTAIAVFFAAIAFGYHRLHKVIELHHQRRWIRIAKHWTEEDERIVWNLVRDSSVHERSESLSTSRPRQWQRDRRVRIGRFLVNAAIFLAVLGGQVFNVLFFVMYPEANRFSRNAGPRAEYSSGIEHTVGVTLTLLAITYTAVLVAAVVGSLVEASGRISERRCLREIIDDPHAVRPPQTALSEYGLRRPAQLAQGLTILSAIAFIFATATVVLGTFNLSEFPDVAERLQPFRPAALIVTAVSVLLFLIACAWNAVLNIRGRDLRNKVIARWPARPNRTTDFRREVVPALIGPALTAGLSSRRPF